MGEPLDQPEYLQIFDHMAEIELPVWMHPARKAAFADYRGKRALKYDLWWAFGWPYETAVAMPGLLFPGLFDRHPDLKIITHHLGGMVPHFEGRVAGGLDQLGKRTDDPDDAVASSRLKKRPVDYFRLFYGDTALFGPAHAVKCGLDFFGAEHVLFGTLFGPAHAVKCGLDFFGAEHVLFGTDMPFDPEGGPGFVRDTINAIDSLDVSQAVREQIHEGKAKRMLRLKVKA